MAIGVLIVFAFWIWAEITYSKKHGLKVYDFREMASHLNIGLGQQAINLFAMTGLVQVYEVIFKNTGFFKISTSNAAAWVLVALASDLTYYWAHRASHRINFFVGIHSVHHQAKDFNYASALRLPWLNRLVMFSFYIPFALMGVPSVMIGTTFLLNLIMGSFAHNGIIRRKLGWMEYVFVTPRTHRVHHGTVGKYLDRNFGGVFIFWDKIFGTFQDLDENEEVRLPGAESPDYHDALTANWDYYQKILFVARHRPGWFNKISTFFETPESLTLELIRYQYSTPTPTSVPPARGLQVAKGIGAMVVLLIALTLATQSHQSLWIRLGLACAMMALVTWTSRKIRGLSHPDVSGDIADKMNLVQESPNRNRQAG